MVAALILLTAIPAGAEEPHADHAASSYDFDEHVPGAERLEGRIRAPCCLKSTGQTLDIHGSPIAIQLRREIRERLKKGETPDQIEADLVKRYGPEILAVPPGNPLKGVGTVLAVLFGAAGVGAAVMLVRWRRRSESDEADAATSDESSNETGDDKASDELDERIDAELRDL